jgi:cholinesterase
MLFGQSAGGASVDMYSYAWTKDPIVSAINPMSGNAANTAPSGSSNKSTQWFQVSKALGCGGEEAGAGSINCMRTKTTQTVLNAFKDAKGLGSIQFRPAADNRVVFTDYAKRRAEGNFIKVPYLTGNTDDEAGISFAINRPAPKAPGILPASKSNAVGKRQAPGQGCGPNAAAADRIKAGVPAWRYLSSMVFPNSDIGMSHYVYPVELSSNFKRQQRNVPWRGHSICIWYPGILHAQGKYCQTGTFR